MICFVRGKQDRRNIFSNVQHDATSIYNEIANRETIIDFLFRKPLRHLYIAFHLSRKKLEFISDGIYVYMSENKLVWIIAV